MRRSWLVALALLASCSQRAEHTAAIDGGSSTLTATSVALERHPGFADARKLSEHALVARDGGFAPVASSPSLRTRLPAHAAGAVHLESTMPARQDVWLDVAPLDLADVPARTDGRTLSFDGVGAAVDLVYAADGHSFEDLRVLRDASASSTARWQLRAAGKLRIREGRVEVVDPDGFVRIASAPIVAIDAAGVRRSLALTLSDDGVLTAKLDAGDLAYPVVLDPLWGTTPAAIRHYGNCNLLTLADGRVLYGWGPVGAVYADIYNPTTNTVSAVTDAAFPIGSSAVLNDGSVLAVASGSTDFARYNPTTNSWTAFAAKQAAACNGCQLVKLGDGRVVKVPSAATAGVSDPTEIFNPSTNTFTTTTSVNSSGLTGSLTNPKTLLLDDGRVFALEGYNPYQRPYFFKPSDVTWSSGASSAFRQPGANLAKLADGRVLVVGFGNTTSIISQVYAPTANAWAATGPMNRKRAEAAAVRLASGNVLAVGGRQPGSTVYSDAEIYQPGADTWTLVDALPIERNGMSGALLGDGSVFLACGFEGSFGSTSTTRTHRFFPVPTGTACGTGALAVSCATGFCVNGVCCASASCPNGVCNAPAVTGRAAGTCALNNGRSCTANAQCASNRCVDGVCCATACAGQCEACNLAGTVGTCAAVTGTPVGTRTACEGAGTECGKKCDGTTRATCVYPPDSTVACGLDGCVGGNETKVGVCKIGVCEQTKAPCGAYACGATACKRSCVESTDCATGYYCGGDKCLPSISVGAACKATSGCATGLTCVNDVCCSSASCDAGSTCAFPGAAGSCKKSNGTKCAAGAECGSGECVDGVCCNRACGGQCEACDAAGNEGTCTPVTGAPHGSRTACEDGGGDVCAAKSCDGPVDATRCVAFANGGTKSCAQAKCDGSSVVPEGFCDGMGKCVTPPSALCGRYQCDTTTRACRDSCTETAQCASGFSCVANKCVEASRCTADGSGSTSVEGVTTSCLPFRCGSDGSCLQKCARTGDCADGLACDLATATCISGGATPDDGGCTYGARPTLGAWGLLFALGLVSRRRRAG